MEASTDPQNQSQANGPTPAPSNAANSWEHPWTVDEIRKNADQWSLAADVGLLEHMKAFASRLTAQAHDVSREVSLLLHDTRLTDAKIQSVTDYFLTLSDSQFIENRVYDEDDTVNEEKEEKPAAKSKTREEREAEMVPKLKEAVKRGLDVIEDAYDVLDVAVADSDSEDEDLPPTDEVILDPKDPYVTRPLPYLIGSHSFHQEDDVGVGDLLSGDEVESVGSLSESEEEIEKPPTVSDVSTSDYDSDDESDLSSDSDVPAKRKTTATPTSSDYTSSDDSELFASKKNQLSDDDSSGSEKPVTKKRAPSKRSQPREQVMFDQDDAGEDLFSGSGGLFGKTGGLFDAPKGGLFEGVDGFSDEQSGSEPEEEPPKPVSLPKTTKNTPAGGVSLFGGAIKKGFFEGDKDSEEEEAPALPADTKTKNFFDDDSSDDDDMFREKPPPMKAKKAASSTSVKKSSDLFHESDEENDDLFNETSDKTAPSKERAPSETKRPAGGVSMFGAGGGALQEALRQRRTTSSSSSASLQKSTNEVNSNPHTSQSKSLFEDASDDNLFAKPTVTSQSKKKSESASKTKKKPPKSDLFGLSSDEDDLFSSSASLQKSTPHSGSLKSLESTATKKSQMGKEKASKKPANSLFGDMDEPLFTPQVHSSLEQTPPRTQKSASNTNLFNASDSDSDLFGSTTNKSSALIQQDESEEDGLFTRKPPAFTNKAASKPDNLFGESDDESLLSPAKSSPPAKKPFPSKKPPSSKKAPPPKKTGLFDNSASDDDDLFSGMSKAKPSVPSTKKKTVEKKPQVEEKSKQAANKTISKKAMQKSKDLFDSDSDEDLFSTKTPVKSETPEVNVMEKESDKEEEIVPEPPKKKLPGAVSMFGAGGGALLEAISKRRSESQKSNVSVNTEKSTESAKLISAPSVNSDEELFGGDASKPKPTLFDTSASNVTAKPFTVPGAETKPVEKVKSPVSKVTPPVSKVTSPVSKVTPPISKVTPPVSKVTPPMSKVTPPTGKSSNVGKLQAGLSINPSALLPGAAPTIPHTTDVDAPLESVTKTRSRGQAGRRPPSRRGRRAAAAGKGNDDPSALVTSTETSQPSTSTAAPASISAPLKGDESLDNILSTPSSLSPAATKKTAKKKTAIPDLFDDDDDLFASKPAMKKESKVPADDLFNSAKSKSSKLEDDFFADDLGIESSSSLFSDSSKKSKKPKLFVDDLFADLDIKPGLGGKKKATPVENGEDFFAAPLTKTEKTKKPKTNEVTLDTDDLFGDTPSMTSSKGKSSKSAKSLFDDEDGDDIFGEMPAVKKTKEKKKSAAPAKSIFDDDDIFSSATPAKKSSRTTKKPKKTNATDKDGAPDLFDDPLSAMLG